MSHETTTGEVDNSLEPEEVPEIQQPPPVQQLPAENGENTHEMAMHLGLPPPEPLDLSGGNVSENWKKFKQKVDIKCTFWLIFKIFLFTPHEKSPKIHYFYVKIKQNPKFNPKF